jgi:hypothetical protein
MALANYTVVSDDSKALVLRDVGPWDRHPTVTNDVEAVVADLVRGGRLPAGKRLFYFDTQGECDEILVFDGRFGGFRHVGAQA